MNNLKKGQKLICRKNGNEVTFIKYCEIGFNNAYVEEIDDYIHLSDFKTIEEIKVKNLYVVMIFNQSRKTWEMTTGFYHKLEDAETVVKSMFYNMAIASLEEQPTIIIFYTKDIYANDIKLISVDDKEEIIIEGGLFENE